MAQDKVQLKREEIVGNDVVLQDIYPKTSTNSITDSTKGIPLDQTLAMIRNMINNKLSRVVNSVNGRTGVVILDARDVGLENVDNISFGDIKRWVIDYMYDIFGTKRLILKEYLSEIHSIIGTNDEAYADIPFYCEKGDAGKNDHMGYIGYIYWDAVDKKLKEEHRQIRVVGYTDRSVIYNEKVGDRDFSHGGLGINIWSGEDALKIRNNQISEKHSPESLSNSGLWLDKSKVVPEVYFFDGVYGTLSGTGDNIHNQNALVYWSSDPHDTTVGNLPIIKIFINGTEANRYSTSGPTPETLHTQQNLKIGDIILTNFSFDQYVNPDDEQDRIDVLYPGMVDSLTCRQPAIGRVIQAADTVTNTPCIVHFYTSKPNVSHGLKLINTNVSSLITPEDTTIGLDLLESYTKMEDGTPIYGSSKSNISGLNALDKHDLRYRNSKSADTKHLYTVYPTGKSNNIFEDTNGQIENNSAFILPNFSLCVIPGYELTQSTSTTPINNWNPSSPMGNNSFTDQTWNMIGINLTKRIWSENNDSSYTNARNISGLRVNTDADNLSESWFGFNTDSDTQIVQKHSGGLSVNVGDFLGIGTSEELGSGNVVEKDSYYDEGKVNVRIDKLKGLYGVEGNKLAINIATGRVYQPTAQNSIKASWLEGGLKFLPDNTVMPGYGPLAVNTGMNASGLAVKNNIRSDTRFIHYGYETEFTNEDNVLSIQQFRFSETNYRDEINGSGIELHRVLTHEDLATKIYIKNLHTSRVWYSTSTLLQNIGSNEAYFNMDTVYVAGGNYYIYAKPNGQNTVIEFFAYYSDENEYNQIRTAMETGTIPAGINQVYTHSIDIIRRRCHVLITPMDPSTDPDKYKIKACVYETGVADLRFPDFDEDGTVNASEASVVLSMYSHNSVAQKIYSDDIYRNFFTDKDLTKPLVLKDGELYVNMSESMADPVTPSHVYYMMYEAVTDPSTKEVYIRRILVSGGNSATLTDIMYADVDRDGSVSAVDASLILGYYTDCSAGKYKNMEPEDSWKRFLKERLGINVVEGAGSVIDILECTYEKGLRLRYNEMMGLTTMQDYVGGSVSKSHEIKTDTLIKNSSKNMLAIKIADKSAGRYAFDPTIAGGLRFATNGYLGIRINTRNDDTDFQATLPTHNKNIEDMSVGTRGLCIDKDNVLGIQLTKDGKTDNGDLCIKSGCLYISSNFKQNSESLTITDGKTTIPYNGKDEVTITLGPGLCFGS